MLRSGKITEIDVNKCMARVTFADDGVVSDFLQIVVMGALSTKFFHIFDINEQVACLMDDNSEEGVILGALFNEGTRPGEGVSKDIVRVLFPDDSVIEYDRASHEYRIDINGAVNITANVAMIEADSVQVDATTVSVVADSVTVDATTVAITGNVTVDGTITATGAVSSAVSLTAPVITGGGLTALGGNVTVTGTVTASDVFAGGKSGKDHTHNVTGGGTTTTPPL